MFQIWTRRVNLAAGYMGMEHGAEQQKLTIIWNFAVRGILSFNMWLDAGGVVGGVLKECLRYAPFTNLPQSAVERKEKN